MQQSLTKLRDASLWRSKRWRVSLFCITPPPHPLINTTDQAPKSKHGCDLGHYMKSYMKYISSKFTRQNKDIFVSDKIHAKCTMYHESKKFLGKMDLIPNQSTEKLRRDLVTCTRGRIQDFFEEGCTRLLLYFNTNKPHSFFFRRIPVVLENCRPSQGRGGWCAPPAPSP